MILIYLEFVSYILLLINITDFITVGPNNYIFLVLCLKKGVNIFTVPDGYSATTDLIS
jgi:hypothetical protein